MAQLTMYPAFAGSKRTTLTADLAVDGTQAFVGDLSAFPVAPNQATFKSDETVWETCLYTAKSAESGAGYLTITRSGEGHDSSASGAALSWSSGALAFRSPTGLDHDRFKANIEDLNANKQNLDATLTAIAGLTTAANKLPYATGEDAFDVCDFTALGRSLVGTTTASAVRDLIASASSTTATQDIYVDSAATGDGTGVDWTNAFTTILAAVNSLPAIINHAVTIYVRKGTTAYDEIIVVQRVVAAGSITIRGEYYWYGTNTSSKTGKITLGASDFGYADRAQIEAGDVVWATKWSGTIDASAPSESIIDTVASVSGAEISLTTNSGKAFNTTWTYRIVNTAILGAIVANCNTTINGISCDGTGGLAAITHVVSGTTVSVAYCYITGSQARGINTTANTMISDCAIKLTGGVGECIRAGWAFFKFGRCVFSGITGIRATGSFSIYNTYNHIMPGTGTGIYIDGNSFVRSYVGRNDATTPMNPASSSESAYILQG